MARRSNKKGRTLWQDVSYSETMADLGDAKTVTIATWMIPHADDQGRMVASPRHVKAKIVPMLDFITVADVEVALQKMGDAGYAILYEAPDGTPLLQFANWWRWQDGQRFVYESEFPPPPGWEDVVRARRKGQEEEEDGIGGQEEPAPDDDGECPELSGNAGQCPTIPDNVGNCPHGVGEGVGVGVGEGELPSDAPRPVAKPPPSLEQELENTLLELNSGNRTATLARWLFRIARPDEFPVPMTREWWKAYCGRVGSVVRRKVPNGDYGRACKLVAIIALEALSKRPAGDFLNYLEKYGQGRRQGRQVDDEIDFEKYETGRYAHLFAKEEER